MPTIKEFEPLSKEELSKLFTPAELDALRSFDEALADARKAMNERRARTAQLMEAPK